MHSGVNNGISGNQIFQLDLTCRIVNISTQPFPRAIQMNRLFLYSCFYPSLVSSLDKKWPNL